MIEDIRRAIGSFRPNKSFIVNSGILVIGVAALTVASCGGVGQEEIVGLDGRAAASYVVLGYNDLGMHCLNEDFSDFCLLPPANTLRAQVIKRGEEPDIVTSGVTVNYSIPGNTTSSNKTNFWDYALPLFGANLAKDMGLAGFGMKGAMKPTKEKDFMAQWIPITPMTDAKQIDNYPLSLIKVMKGARVLGQTQAVVPVSWEITCNKCHTGTTAHEVAMGILKKHDQLEGTNLVNQRPVLCAKCHSDNALGAPGVAGVSSMSSAMHGFHADKFAGQSVEKTCYSCHPGPETQCFRDVHKAKGMDCNSCHVSMKAVADPARRPWIDEPRCGSCHNVKGHEYEQPGKLFRDSVGHNGVKCIACHGSPHAITPSTNERDNVQNMALQGSAGPLKKCSVCHTKTPEGKFNHSRDD